MARKTPFFYANVLSELTEGIAKNHIESALNVFLKYISKEQVIKQLPRIVDAYIAMAEQKSGKVRVHIRTAHELNDKDVNKIAKQLGEDVEYTHAVDKNLIGGFVAENNTLRLDASIARTLTRLQSHLI